MNKPFKKAFTLIELIIVIAIIAILAVTAFLVLTKWMGKSRDSRRVNDISAINSALQIYTSDASLIPLPDSYSGVYDTGYALARYQGNFTDTQASQLSNISKNIKDPQNGYYGYSVTYDRKQYQLRALTESTVSYQNNITNEVSAASQTAKLQGNYAGFVVTATGSIHALWNIPSLFLFSGTAITSGYLFTGGNNNFLQDNKTTDNTYPVAIVDVSNLYNASTSDDSAVYTNIINAYSGTNNVTTSGGVTAILQSAAGWLGANTIPSVSTQISGNDAYTKLLLHFDNNVTDSSSNNYIITNNSATFSTNSKFGGYSASFNGTNCMTAPNIADFQFGNSDFTIDFWFNTSSSSIQPMVTRWTGASGGPNDSFWIMINAGNIEAYPAIGGTYRSIATSSTNYADGNWHHLAWVRSGSDFYLFLDGILKGTRNVSGSISPGIQLLEIGQGNGGMWHFVGNLDELRISKGIARRTSNFTSPNYSY